MSALAVSVGSPGLWRAFLVFLAVMLALDLGVFHRRAHEVSLGGAIALSLRATAAVAARARE
jgi:tellurite resistance protein TerC